MTNIAAKYLVKYISSKQTSFYNYAHKKRDGWTDAQTDNQKTIYPVGTGTGFYAIVAD